MRAMDSRRDCASKTVVPGYFSELSPLRVLFSSHSCQSRSASSSGNKSCDSDDSSGLNLLLSVSVPSSHTGSASEDSFALCRRHGLPSTHSCVDSVRCGRGLHFAALPSPLCHRRPYRRPNGISSLAAKKLTQAYRKASLLGRRRAVTKISGALARLAR